MNGTLHRKLKFRRKSLILLSNSVTRQVNFDRTKIGGKCQNSKIQIRHFGWFSNTVPKSTRQQAWAKFFFPMTPWCMARLTSFSPIVTPKRRHRSSRRREAKLHNRINLLPHDSSLALLAFGNRNAICGFCSCHKKMLITLLLE